MLDSPAARSFIEQILSQSGADEGLEVAVREEMIQQMLAQLTEMVNAELLDSLNAHQMRHLEQMLDDSKQADIEQYLSDQGVSSHEVVARAMRRMQVEYLG